VAATASAGQAEKTELGDLERSQAENRHHLAVEKKGLLKLEAVVRLLSLESAANSNGGHSRNLSLKRRREILRSRKDNHSKRGKRSTMHSPIPRGQPMQKTNGNEKEW